MKKTLLLGLLLLGGMVLSAQGNFTLKSKQLGGQAVKAQVYNGFGCTGNNLSPQLYWADAPTGTKSFAITMYDPDAPTGSGWWHWVVFNLPASCKELPQGAGNALKQLMPLGTVQSLNDFGSYGYGGPCPPENDGIHEYIITIYALDVDKLELEKNSNPAMVGFNIHAHTLEKASLVFYYQR